MTFCVMEWNLVRVQPSLFTIRLKLGFDNVIFGCIRLHHTSVAFPKKVCFLLLPRQIVVGFANNLLWSGTASSQGEVAIATKVD